MQNAKVPWSSPSSVTIVEEGGAPGPLRGTPFLVCFPSAGLASTIVGHHAIRHLKLPRVATVRSRELPSAAVIVDRRPNPPVRIHANPTLAVAVSEFPSPSSLTLPLAEALLAWAQSKALGPVVVVEGVLPRGKDGTPEGAAPPTSSARPEPKDDVMGIAATAASEPLLEQAKVPILVEGIVSGLTAELLNLASITNQLLGVIFVQTAEPGYPDYRAAARLAEILDRIVPGLALDPAPMLDQAEILERMLKEGMKMTRHEGAKEEAAPAEGPTSPSMYG